MEIWKIIQRIRFSVKLIFANFHTVKVHTDSLSNPAAEATEAAWVIIAEAKWPATNEPRWPDSTSLFFPECFVELNDVPLKFFLMETILEATEWPRSPCTCLCLKKTKNRVKISSNQRQKSWGCSLVQKCPQNIWFQILIQDTSLYPFFYNSEMKVGQISGLQIQ